MNAVRRGASAEGEDSSFGFVRKLRSARGPTDFVGGLRAARDEVRTSKKLARKDAFKRESERRANEATDALYSRIMEEYRRGGAALAEVDALWTSASDGLGYEVPLEGLQSFSDITAHAILRGQPTMRARAIAHALDRAAIAARDAVYVEHGLDLADDDLDVPDETEEEAQEAIDRAKAQFISMREFMPLKRLRSEFEPTARRWFVVRDLACTVPLHVGGESTRRRFAEDYRSGITDFRGTEMVVCVVPGEEVQLILWSADPLSDSKVRQWCSSAYGGERFEPATFPWPVPVEAHRVYLGASAPTRLPLASEATPTAPTAAAVIRTGFRALDAQFRTGGLPMGVRLCMSGPPGACKTTALLEIAEAALEQGSFVLWLAEDERPEQLTARRLQRRGLSPTEAAALPRQHTTKLDALPFYVTEGIELERAWELAWNAAGGRPLFLVCDSLQKTLSAAGEGKGDRERIDATLAAIVQCQQQWPARVAFTSEVARGSGEAKGSIGIDYSSTLHLGLKRRGETVEATIRKNRHGSEQAFALKVDQDKQRMLNPGEAADGGAKRTAWDEIKRALTDHGPMSGSKIEAWVTGRGATIREVLRERTAVGDLVREGVRYSLR